MATTRKTAAKPAKRKPAKKGAKRTARCSPSFTVSQAGHLLKTKRRSSAGSTLSKAGKKEKAARKRRGCLHGVRRQGKAFKLTAKQKARLPLALQKAILKFHHGK